MSRHLAFLEGAVIALALFLAWQEVRINALRERVQYIPLTQSEESIRFEVWRQLGEMRGDIWRMDQGKAQP
jgi:hypothetical protein